jgi:Ni/Fe-hydrogenase subunit HybB-like protein
VLDADDTKSAVRRGHECVPPDHAVVAMAEMKHANVACALAFVGIWIEKGMGLIIPGFVPSTLHEWVEYIPSAAEWKIMAGIWASGLIVYTLLLKVAIPVFTGNVSGRRAK